jgi:hypothetical protein
MSLSELKAASEKPNLRACEPGQWRHPLSSAVGQFYRTVIIVIVSQTRVVIVSQTRVVIVSQTRVVIVSQSRVVIVSQSRVVIIGSLIAGG